MLVLIILALFLVAATMMEFIHLPFWWVRIFDFPHFQIWWLSLFTLIIALVFFRPFTKFQLVVFGLLTLALLYKSYKIYPYTVLAPKKAAAAENVTDNNTVSLLIVNVLMKNREQQGLADQIKSYSPDIIILLEPDQWWEDSFNYLKKEYPYILGKSLDNTYGMLVYSRLKLESGKVMHITRDDIPSISTLVRLKNGEAFKLYSIHPLPPAPKQDTDERDAELLTFAKFVKENNEPCIVAGDLNDVAWSRTTELFLEESGMLDPRLGRGYYNSFNAKIPFLRYPLDHVFFSPDFRLIDMQRGDAFGSDHFPIYINLSYEPQGKADHDLPERPDEEDKEEIEEIRGQDQRPD